MSSGKWLRGKPADKADPVHVHICAKCSFTYKGARYWLKWETADGKIKDGWCDEACYLKLR